MFFHLIVDSISWKPIGVVMPKFKNQDFDNDDYTKSSIPINDDHIIFDEKEVVENEESIWNDIKSSIPGEC